MASQATAAAHQDFDRSKSTVRIIAERAWPPLAFLASALWLVSIPAYVSMLPEGVHSENFVVTLTPLFITMNVLWAVLSLGVTLLALILGWVFYQRKDKEKLALFLAYFMVLHGIGAAGTLEVLDVYVPGLAVFTADVLQAIFFLPLTFILAVLFPDGNFVPRWTRFLIPVVFLSGILTSQLDYRASVSWSDTLPVLLMVSWAALIGVMLYAQVFRYRHVSSMEQRQQTKWFLYGVIVFVVLSAASSPAYFILVSAPEGSPLPWWAPVGTLFWVSSMAALPASIAVAILRYRLFNIDTIINRTVFYTLLTASVVLVYIMVVGGLGVIFQTTQNLVISLVGTGLVAVLLNPIRIRLQNLIDHYLYGQRGNPSAVLERLHQSFETLSDPQSLLEGTAATISKALRLPYVEFDLAIEAKRFSASAGEKVEPVIEIPLHYQSERIGKLSVSSGSSGEDLTEHDEKLLRQIAAQTTTAILAVHLAEDLQKARTNLVTTREEERRRLRRDLHDSLGPLLASQGLKVAAARELMSSNPERARQMLEEVVGQNESTVREIRRMVYGLRPPALDELGLQGALNDFANNMHDSSSSFAIRIHTPLNGLPGLPAAVEVAAYRIVTEAVTNASKHASAKVCTVTLALSEQANPKHLRVEIKDNGKGLLDKRRAGVGLNSMRERCEEIGGTFEIESTPGKGTRVTAILPLNAQGR